MESPVSTVGLVVVDTDTITTDMTTATRRNTKRQVPRQNPATVVVVVEDTTHACPLTSTEAIKLQLHTVGAEVGLADRSDKHPDSC